MKTLFIALSIAAIFRIAPAFADSPARSPLAGHWTLDLDKLPMPAEARPKRVDLDFRDAGDGKWKSRVEIVDQNDKMMYAESTLSLDGTPGRASGTYWVDVCAAEMPVPNVLVMQFAYQGAPTSTRVYSTSADGKTLTETEAFFRKDGTPAMRTAVFARAPNKR